MSLEQILALVNGPLGQGAFGGIVMAAVLALLQAFIKPLRAKVLKTPTKADDYLLDAIEAGMKASGQLIAKNKKLGGK